MSQHQNQSQAIARRRSANEIAAQVAQENHLSAGIHDPSEFMTRLRQVEQIGFVCTPFTPSAIPQGYSVSEQIVLVNPELQEKEVYKGFFCNGDEVALTKIGVLKIFRAMGASVVFSNRTDDRSDPAYCSWSVMVRVRDITGAFLEYPGSKEVDLREGGAEAENVKKQALDDRKQFDPKKYQRLLNQARQNIMSNCETKALLRAVRGIAGIRPVYRKEDLASKPFYCFRLQFEPDMTNPRVQEIVTLAEMGLAGQLYGAAQSPTIPYQAQLNPPPPLDGPVNESGVIDGSVDESSDDDLPSSSGPGPRSKREALTPNDDDLPLFPDPPASNPAPHGVCACACGCQKSLAQKEANAVKDRFGAERCYTCVPGTSFDEARHRELGGRSMGLAKGDMTFDQAITESRKLKKEHAQSAA